MNKGTILGFHGSWSSGIATLIVKNDQGERIHLLCENTATIRALDAVYGNVIRLGRMASQEPFVGKIIFYEYDDLGLLLEKIFPACDSCGKKPAAKMIDGHFYCRECIQYET